jgi:protein-L-isoaspartate(D-aspartate) O-methyltransferase
MMECSNSNTVRPGFPFRYAARVIVALCCLFPVARSTGDEQATYRHQRAQLVELIERQAQSTGDYLDRDSLSARVIDRLASVPRHEFVPASQRVYAYENRPLPIGHGQTISQPYIVAIMTDLLEPEADDRVLEIGTGSGYQAAVLAGLVKQVYSIEIIPALAGQARKTLDRLGYTNIETRTGDGYFGWEDQAPFDAILVTAAADHVPPPLIKQLKRGGRMLIPVGSRFMTQQLVLVEKADDGSVTTRLLLPVRFVPLTGEH